jgi:hypothetical protein
MGKTTGYFQSRLCIFAFVNEDQVVPSVNKEIRNKNITRVGKIKTAHNVGYIGDITESWVLAD